MTASPVAVPSRGEARPIPGNEFPEVIGLTAVEVVLTVRFDASESDLVKIATSGICIVIEEDVYLDSDTTEINSLSFTND